MAPLIAACITSLSGLLALGVLLIPLLAAGRTVPQLAYYAQQQRDGAIYLLDVERMLSARLYHSRDWVLSMAWSPDGERLAFTAQESRLLIMGADGRQVRELVGRGAGYKPMAWTTDGRNIIFEASVATSTIMDVADIETGEIYSLTEHISALSTDFRWSPDGQQAVFAAHDPRSQTFDLYTMPHACIEDSAQCQFRRLTDTPADDRSPIWSPDGERIAFLSDRSGPLQLYVVAVNCDEPPCEAERLLDAEVNDSVLAWSPDGRWLAFGVSAGGYGSLLHLIDMQCEDCAAPRVERITPDGDVDSAAAWSPDGAHLAYVSSKPVQLAHIVILDVTCAEQSTCMQAEGRRRLTGGVFRAWFPAWRPSQ